MRILLIWMVLSVVVGLACGAWLKRLRKKHYPTSDELWEQFFVKMEDD